MTAVRDRVVDRARGMRDLVRAEAAESDRLRTLSAPIVDGMWASGLMSAFNPAAAGGVEPSFHEMIEMWIEMAWQDRSFGWTGIANLPSAFAAATYLPDEGFAEMFTRNDNHITVGGQYFRNGQGTVVDGGYRLSGAWNFGSGTGHSAYIGAGFFPMDDGEMRWVSESIRDMRSHFCFGRKSPSPTDGMSRDSKAPAPTTTTWLTCSYRSAEPCRCSPVSPVGESPRPVGWV